VEVKVKEFVTLKQTRVRQIRLAEGADIAALVRQLGLELEDVGFLSVNGRQAMLDQTLQDGDSIHIIPPIGGG
jgi:molybdopterin converting factor small subunit